MSKNLGYRGYIFSKEIGGNFIPQRVQNLVIKDYANKKYAEIQKEKEWTPGEDWVSYSGPIFDEKEYLY